MRVGSVSSFTCSGCRLSFNIFCKVGEEEGKGCPACGEDLVREVYQKSSKCFTPYYNRQLDQTFYTKDDEKTYTKKNGLVNITGEHKAWRSGRGGWKNKAD